MNNIFNIINNFIHVNDTPTYGDLINENKQEVKQNAIKRLCDSQEYQEYESLYNFDKARIINENYNELKDNYIMGNIKRGNTVKIPGIGEVNQIC